MLDETSRSKNLLQSKSTTESSSDLSSPVRSDMLHLHQKHHPIQKYLVSSKPQGFTCLLEIVWPPLLPFTISALSIFRTCGWIWRWLSVEKWRVNKRYYSGCLMEKNRSSEVVLNTASLRCLWVDYSFTRDLQEEYDNGYKRETNQKQSQVISIRSGIVIDKPKHTDFSWCSKLLCV